MQWFELLTVAVFLLFPLLLELLQKRQTGSSKSPTEEVPEDYGDDDVYDPETIATEDESTGWSADWGEWPSEPADDQLAVETVLEADELQDLERAEKLLRRQEEMPAEHTPEVARVFSPVVSMEPTRIDRRAEHSRFHRTIESRPALAERKTTTPRVAELIRNQSDLRRGVLLAEILGPPKGLQ